MSKPAKLQTLVERYLVERHRLGFAMRDTGYALRSFGHYVDSIGYHAPLTAEIMADCPARQGRRGHGIV
jgi:hypothetical protein